MARELIKKVIDGHEYEFQQFGAKDATKCLIRLSKIVGKPLAMAMGGIQGGGDVMGRELNLNVLGEAVGALTERLDEDETLSLLEKFTSTPALLCDGKQVNFNAHYEGRLNHMFKVLRAALEVQYGNFFDAMSDLLPQVQSQVTTKANQT